jgi:hypothetical protein
MGPKKSKKKTVKKVVTGNDVEDKIGGALKEKMGLNTTLMGMLIHLCIQSIRKKMMDLHLLDLMARALMIRMYLTIIKPLRIMMKMRNRINKKRRKCQVNLRTELIHLQFSLIGVTL